MHFSLAALLFLRFVCKLLMLLLLDLWHSLLLLLLLLLVVLFAFYLAAVQRVIPARLHIPQLLFGFRLARIFIINNFWYGKLCQKLFAHAKGFRMRAGAAK